MAHPKLVLVVLSVILVATPQARAQPIDLLFLVDETGTMGAEIASLQSQGSSLIVPVAAGALEDVAFGVAGYRDFPVSPFGDLNDVAYTLKSPISTSVATFQAGLNGLVAGGGGDAEEAGLHALHIAATVSPGWRPGATRVIFWIGDAPSHDGDLESSYASCCSAIGLGDATAALGAANIAVYAFSLGTPGMEATGQADAVSSATDGALATDLTVGEVISEIVAVIEGPLANPAPVCGDGVLEGIEECDDGNNDDGDGCSAVCLVECFGGDADGDTVCDIDDNCPFVANADQLDRGGVNVAPDTDGIGDACQCGDVTGDGIVNFVDAIMINREASPGLTAPLFLVPGNCDVTMDGLCNFVDAIMINREVSPGLTAPLFNADGCPNARPPTPPMPCGPFGLTCDTAVEICVSRTPVGPAVIDSCDPVPAGCEQDRSCACAGSTVCAAPFSDCTDVSLNTLQCECTRCQ